MSPRARAFYSMLYWLRRATETKNPVDERLLLEAKRDYEALAALKPRPAPRGDTKHTSGQCGCIGYHDY